jgi:DNA-binding transcriptional regulator YiaG
MVFTTQAIPESVARLADQVRASRLPPAEERVRIRERAQVSKRALARACEVTTATVIKWEAGATPRPGHAAVYHAALQALQEASC